METGLELSLKSLGGNLMEIKFRYLKSIRGKWV